MAKASFTIQVKGNGLEASRAVLAFSSKQVPFAAAAALTELAREARDVQKAAMRDRFEVRSKRFLQTVRSVPAEKRDWPNTHSIVGVLDEWAARHEPGGTFKPKKSRRWAIPGAGVKRTKSGKIRKKKRPRALIEAGKAFERDDVILLRVGRGRKRLRLAYTLDTKIKLDPALKMRETVEAVAAARFGPLWKKWLLRALN